MAFGGEPDILAALAAARERGCLTIAFTPGSGAEWEFDLETDRRPAHPPGDRRDALPHAVGARAHLPRPPRAAGGSRGAAGARLRRVELPLSVPRPAGERPRRDPRRRAAVDPPEGRGDHRAARADADGVRRRRCVAAAAVLRARLDAGGRLIALGNGGSATDAMDVVADFRTPMFGGPARRALDLTEDTGIITAVANDIGTDAIFPRQVIAYGAQGRRAARDVDERQLAEHPRGAARGAPARAWSRSRSSATTAATSPRTTSPTTSFISRSENIPRIQEAQASGYHVLRELVELRRDLSRRPPMSDQVAGHRRGACASRSTAPCRASATGRSSIASPTSSASRAGSSTTSAASSSRPRARRRPSRRSSSACAPTPRRWPTSAP